MSSKIEVGYTRPAGHATTEDVSLGEAAFKAARRSADTEQTEESKREKARQRGETNRERAKQRGDTRRKLADVKGARYQITSDNATKIGLGGQGITMQMNDLAAKDTIDARATAARTTRTRWTVGGIAVPVVAAIAFGLPSAMHAIEASNVATASATASANAPKQSAENTYAPATITVLYTMDSNGNMVVQNSAQIQAEMQADGAAPTEISDVLNAVASQPGVSSDTSIAGFQGFTFDYEAVNPTTGVPIGNSDPKAQAAESAAETITDAIKSITSVPGVFNENNGYLDLSAVGATGVTAGDITIKSVRDNGGGSYTVDTSAGTFNVDLSVS